MHSLFLRQNTKSDGDIHDFHYELLLHCFVYFKLFKHSLESRRRSSENTKSTHRKIDEVDITKLSIKVFNKRVVLGSLPVLLIIIIINNNIMMIITIIIIVMIIMVIFFA